MRKQSAYTRGVLLINNFKSFWVAMLSQRMARHGELWDLCGSNSADVRSGTDARFPCLNKRCASVASGPSANI